MTFLLLFGLACASTPSTPEPTLAAPIDLSVTLGAEHRRRDGTWRPFTATSRVTSTPLAPADRLWVDAQAAGASKLYVITQSRDGLWEILHDGAPGLTPALEVSDVPWRLWVLASSAPVEWLTGAGRLDCSRWTREIAPDVPTDACSFLAGLHRLAPPAPRTPEPRPATASLTTPEGTTLRGFHAEHRRPDQAAVVFDVTSR